MPEGTFENGENVAMINESGEYSDEILAALKELYRLAQNNQITIDKFFDELEELRITDFSQALHACEAFGTSLNETKQKYIERMPGGMRAWEKQFDNVDFDFKPRDFLKK